MPIVTVVIPVRDRARLLGETLESVLVQSLEDWECLIVDDGSTDGTPAVAKRYCACDPRFRYMRIDGGSAAAARNHGLRAARARFVTFLDSDDLFTPDRLEWQVAELLADPGAVLVYGDTLHFDESGQEALYLGGGPRPAGPRALPELLVTSAIYAPLVRRDSLRLAGAFDESLPSAEDWDAWLALSKLGALIYRPRLALRYRVHAGNKSSQLTRNLACARLVLEKHLPDVALARRVQVRLAAEQGFRRRYGPRLLEAAQRQTRAGEWERARPLWRALASLQPARLLSRSVLLHTVWSCLPTSAAPQWRSWMGGARRAGVRGG